MINMFWVYVLCRSNKQQEKERKFKRIQTEHIKSEFLPTFP